MAGIFCNAMAAIGVSLGVCVEDTGTVQPPDLGPGDPTLFDFKSRPAPEPVQSGRLLFIPGRIDFGTVKFAGRVSTGVTVKNVGGKNVELHSVLIGMSEGAGVGNLTLAANQCSELDLPPGGECRVEVAFQASAETGGQVRGELVVSHTGPERASKALIAGKAGPRPVLVPPVPTAPALPKVWPKPLPDPNANASNRILKARRVASWGEVGTEDLEKEPTIPPSGRPVNKGKYMDDEYSHPEVEGGLPVDNSRIVTTVRYIHAVVETSVNSQVSGESGGKIILQVTKDVFAANNDDLLIPKGSRLDCSYESLEKDGDSRLPVICHRVLRGEDYAELYEIAGVVGDTMGRAGVPGEIDRRIWERYGSSFVVAGISTMAAAGANMQSDSDSLFDGAGTELSQSLGEISAKILEQTVNLAPIITIAQGTRVIIIPRNDWILKRPTRGDVG